MEHHSGEPDSVVEYDSQPSENTALGDDDQVPEKESGGTTSYGHLVFKTLNLTEVSLELGLHGPIPSTTYRSKTRLASSFGFASSAVITDWMSSEAFKPYYTTLQANLRKYVSAEKMKNLRQKPRLTLVQSTIIQGEGHGILKYSRRAGPELEIFTAIDFYALFLFYVVEYNSLYAEGAFFGKKMSLEDMQTRAWQAMLRASLEDTTRQSREE